MSSFQAIRLTPSKKWIPTSNMLVPPKQTAAIEWNKVTNKGFHNILKKWSLTVTKSDSEKGLPQR